MNNYKSPPTLIPAAISEQFASQLIEDISVLEYQDVDVLMEVLKDSPMEDTIAFMNTIESLLKKARRVKTNSIARKNQAAKRDRKKLLTSIDGA